MSEQRYTSTPDGAPVMRFTRLPAHLSTRARNTPKPAAARPGDATFRLITRPTSTHEEALNLLNAISVSSVAQHGLHRQTVEASATYALNVADPQSDAISTGCESDWRKGTAPGGCLWAAHQGRLSRRPGRSAAWRRDLQRTCANALFCWWKTRKSDARPARILNVALTLRPLPSSTP